MSCCCLSICCLLGQNLLPPLPKHNNIFRLVGFSDVPWASGTKFVSSWFRNLVRWWDLRRNGGVGPVSQSPSTGPSPFAAILKPDSQTDFKSKNNTCYEVDTSLVDVVLKSINSVVRDIMDSCSRFLLSHKIKMMRSKVAFSSGHKKCYRGGKIRLQANAKLTEANINSASWKENA
uniref:Uncharacterized protein n=1 Tax=Tanacetum cinerariifolium TaxID=118510 RepID=A0A699L8B4_TANCI|nr:hypothetical protein [Tanacetum cinerariifolium]